MTLSRPAFLALLLERHAELRSWRKVAQAYYPGVTFQVLNKIALHGIFPKDRAILKLLGVEGQGRRARLRDMEPIEREIEKTRRRTKRKVMQMAKETEQEVLRK
jgi:hypothetical protein